MKNKHRIKPVVWALLIGALSSLAAVLAADIGIFKQWELKTYDLRMRHSPGSRLKPQNVVMFYVDEGSLSHMESQGINWPWPRELYSAALDFCRRGGARAVVFDLFFSEDSVYGVGDDEAFAVGIRQGPPSSFVLFLSKEDSPPDPREAPIVKKSAVPFEKPFPPWISVENSLDSLPIGIIADAAESFGNVQIPPDDDGIYRRLSLIETLGKDAIPSLPLKVASDIKRVGKILWPGRTKFLFGDTAIPLDDDGRMLINYYGGVNTFPNYPLAKILLADAAIAAGQKPEIDPAVLKGKVVIIGVAVPGLYDLKSTPFSRTYPGPEIHATVIENLLASDYITPANKIAAASTTLATGLLAVIGLAVIESSWGIGAWLAILAVSLAAGGSALFSRGLYVPLVAPFGALSLSSFAMVLKNYLTEGRKKRAIRQAFGQYLSPHVVGEISRNPDSLKLGGVLQEVTLFFSDIADFTTISEKTPPPELVKLLNEYFLETTKIIQGRDGTLDKYIGDAIMAFWGAPLFVADHAARAVLAALEIQKALGARKMFSSRIGINTGSAVVGNIGSDIRFNYTAIGDTVNLASRLEGLNKKFGTSIIISDTSYESAKSAIEARKIGRVRVKGREKSLAIYEPLGPKGDFGKYSAEICAEFSRALDLYEAAKFPEALLAFRLITDRCADPVSARYIESCDKFQKEAPADFDGVTTFMTK